MSVDKPINSEEISEDVSFEIGPYFVPPGYEVICTDPSHNMGRFFYLDHCSGIKLKRPINSVSPAKAWEGLGPDDDGSLIWAARLVLDNAQAWMGAFERDKGMQNSLEVMKSRIPVSPARTPDAKIPCYEVYDHGKIDCIVFEHSRMEDLQNHIWLLMDSLEAGESIRIEFKNYTQGKIDEIYDEL